MKTRVHLLYLAEFSWEWEMFQTKVVDKIKKKHNLCSVTFFPPENLAVYEIIWKNMVQRSRPQITRGRMRIACWITKATNTHSEYVILIAFPLQQWLHERASMLCYTYIVCHGEARCCHVTSPAGQPPQSAVTLFASHDGVSPVILLKILQRLWVLNSEEHL